MRACVRVPSMLLAGIALSAGATPAQMIRGLVRDELTDRPVIAAQVTLLTAEGRKLDRTVTDSVGGFEIEPDLAGAYRLRLEAPGYRTSDSARVDVAYGELVEVTIRMAVDAVPLQPLTVTARSHPPSKYLEEAGFYERRKAGIGLYLTREDIMRRAPEVFSDLMRTVAGMTVQSSGATGRTGASMTIRSNGRCQPVLFLDGTHTLVGGVNPRGRDTPLDDILIPRDIEGLELYRGSASVPAEFNRNIADCGALVVWTRRK